MDYVTLGHTGLRASVMGVGCGGPSRAGQSTGKTQAESVAVIRQALDAGVNFIDTSEAYRTEEIVGQAIAGIDRDSVILSTKKRTRDRLAPKDVRRSLEASLKRLGTDYVDIYHLHGVMLGEYDYLLAEIVPAVRRLRDEGKIRFIGITERFNADTQHATLERALQDDVWDVIMVGFNLLNQSARRRVLPMAIDKEVGVLVMFAVRLALSRPARLAEVVAEMVEQGQLDPASIDRADPLGFLLHEGDAISIPDAAYRFCRYEPGTHVVLSGTGNPDHLRANIASLSRPPLSPEHIQKLMTLFGRVDCVTGQ